MRNQKHEEKIGEYNILVNLDWIMKLKTNITSLKESS
jgi:hypothetical protein